MGMTSPWHTVEVPGSSPGRSTVFSTIYTRYLVRNIRHFWGHFVSPSTENKYLTIISVRNNKMILLQVLNTYSTVVLVPRVLIINKCGKPFQDEHTHPTSSAQPIKLWWSRWLWRNLDMVEDTGSSPGWSTFFVENTSREIASQTKLLPLSTSWFKHKTPDFVSHECMQ